MHIDDEKTYNVSVIVPVYNAELYLNDCMDSVLSQSLDSVEIICIDDGSTDDSSSIIKQYCSQFSNVRLIEQQNSGPASARNRGVQEAKGKYVFFLDADDLVYDCSVLEKLYNFAIEKNVKIIGGNTILFDSDWKKGRRYNPGICEMLTEEGIVIYTDYGCPFGYTRFLYERDFLIDKNIKFPQYKCWEDPVFMTEAFSVAKEFYAIKDYVYCYRRQIHRKEHRVDDAVALINASVEIMRYANKYRNRKLADCMLGVIFNSYENISYASSIRPEIVLPRMEVIKQLVFDDLGEQYDELISRLNMSAFCRENHKYDQDILVFSKLISGSRSCVIYGAGEYGKRLFWLMEDLDVLPVGFAETERTNDLDSMLGVAVKSLDEWDDDCIFLIAVKNSDTRNGMFKTLIELGLTGYVVSDRLLNRTIHVVKHQMR